jgi:putative membrane protein
MIFKSSDAQPRDSHDMKTKSPRILLTLNTLILGVALVAFTSNTRADDSKLTSKDKSFITDASEAGATEIQESELANKKSSNAEVKSLADMMIKDHTKAGAELEKIATSKGGNPSKSPGVAQKADILLLKSKSGSSFDKAFAEDMVSDHKKAVELFTKASTDLDDADLKAFAEKTLPTLKHHLEAAEKLAESVGK